MRFDYGSDMWNYLATRFEGRENEMTTLYTQRAVRQKLESASCRPGADVENRLLYMMGIREQLVVLDADVSDSWMVDFMVRSVSQLPFYRELRTLMLTGGLHTMKTPDQVKSMILVLDKEELVDNQSQVRINPDVRDEAGGGRQGGRSNGGKPMPKYQNRNKDKSTINSGGSQKYSGYFKRRTDEQQRQYEEDRENKSCFGCHQPGHTRRNCPEEMKPEPKNQNGSSVGNVRNHANFTHSSGVASREPQGPAQKQEGRAYSREASQSKKGTAKYQQKLEYQPETWVFDNGATQHLVGDKRYFFNYRDLTLAKQDRATVHGYNGKSTPIGIGSIDLWINVNDNPVVLRVENVYYSPQRTNLQRSKDSKPHMTTRRENTR
ncbi:gag-polypeptide of LTR copia-type [Phytophthora infestans]|uniref:Gag-polypeptide of LTR copia-type n=1 Tax=Phytophthora infestans TaxID=4787 RepID=A0A833SPH8_PHYIN|nr:gag-polypeptide of LTR copia-type [Phytophthora infestans]